MAAKPVLAYGVLVAGNVDFVGLVAIFSLLRAAIDPPTPPPTMAAVIRMTAAAKRAINVLRLKPKNMRFPAEIEGSESETYASVTTASLPKLLKFGFFSSL